jgi:hypothetical protein
MRVLSVVVLLISLGLGSGLPNPSAASGYHGTYRNSLAHRVPRPWGDWRRSPPLRGATTLCGDGTNSFSEHPGASGTCSHHGGVKSYVGSGQGTSQTEWHPYQTRAGYPQETPILVDPREIPLR